MPWKVVQRGEQHCVIKENTGETVKCHPTRDKAISHQQALYSNYDKEQLVLESELKRGKPLLMPSVAQLQVALETVENNLPLNEAEGNVEQANLEREHAASFREAIALLTSGKSLNEALERKVRSAFISIQIKGGAGSGNFGHTQHQASLDH